MTDKKSIDSKKTTDKECEKLKKANDVLNSIPYYPRYIVPIS